LTVCCSCRACATSDHSAEGLRLLESNRRASAVTVWGTMSRRVKTRLSRARLERRDGLYERAGVVTGAAFTFGAERCDRLVAAVLSRLRGELLG
jgi:hypothetical protein